MPTNITMTTPGYRDYDLLVSKGELYEVWLRYDWEEPKTCVAVGKIATDVVSPNWEILVDGSIQQVHESQIFRIKTATRPEPPYSFPGTKKVVAALITNKIVSVQPMTAPTSMQFFMDYKFEKSAEDR
jgi:hypothetical protein